MSTQQEIIRLQTARTKIRDKLITMGLAESGDKLDILADTIDGIPMYDDGAGGEVKEGETFTIPRGYHNGSGTVKGVAGGGNYTLQSKTVTPTKSQQSIVPDPGTYGLSGVTVKAIPENYQDVTDVDATAADVLANKKIVASDGTLVAGTMPNNGANMGMLTPASAVHTIPKGYHNGLGTVGVVTEEKEFTPTKETQTHTATAKFVTKVTINPIPDEYQDVTKVTATAHDVLTGTQFVDAEGNVVEGAMVDHSGSDSVILDTTKSSYAIPEGFHDGGATVDILLEEKSATPTKSEQTITPTAGKVLSKVTVAAIPAAYQDVTGVTAEAAHVLDGKFFVSKTGVKTEGTMPNNADVSASMDGLTKTSVTIPAGFTTGGTISLTDDIENALAAI